MTATACPVTTSVMAALVPGDRMALLYMDGAAMNHTMARRPGPSNQRSTMIVMLTHIGYPTAHVGYWTLACDSGTIEEVPC